MVKGLGAVEITQHRFDATSDTVLDAMERDMRVSIGMDFLRQLVPTFLVILTISYAAWLAHLGEITPGELVSISMIAGPPGVGYLHGHVIEHLGARHRRRRPH